MRVLFVGPFPWPSPQGSQAYLSSQVRALVRRAHDVTLAVYGAGRGGEICGATVIRGRRFPGGDFDNGGLHPSRPLHDLALARAVRRHCRVHPPDVIHAHNVEGPLVARLAHTSIPVVYDLHTRMADELGAHLPRGLRWLGRPLGAAFDHAAMFSSQAGCAISDRAEKRLLGHGLPTTRVGPAIDLEELDAGPPPPLPPGPRVVYTGNLDRYQDLPVLIQAMRTVPATLVVVTGSDNALPGDVHVVRSTNFREALAVLSCCEVAVIPRRRCEGFPIKLLNQLGMGVPTVMMQSAGVDLPGVVLSSPTGLAQTLQELLADQPRRKRLGDAGAACVRRDHSLEGMGERLEELYRRLST